jgi:hypothetical protein
MAGVALNAVKTAAVNGHHGTLHVDEIVLAQTASSPFMFLNKHCATLRLLAPELRRLQAQGSRLRALGFGLRRRALGSGSGSSTKEPRRFVPASCLREPGVEANHRLLTASSTCLASAS